MEKLLQELITLFEASKSVGFNEERANAFIAAAYVKLQWSMIQKNDAYLPNKEIDLLFYVISNFPSKTDDVLDQLNVSKEDVDIVPQLVLALIKLLDISFHRRNQDQSVILEKAAELFNRLPESAFQLVHSSQLETTATLEHLMTSKEFRNKIKQKTYPLEELLDSIDDYIDKLPRFLIVEDPGKEKVLIRHAIASLDVGDFFRMYSRSFTYSSETIKTITPLITDEVFKKILPLLAEKYADKDKFVIACLDACKKLCLDYSGDFRNDRNQQI